MKYCPYCGAPHMRARAKYCCAPHATAVQRQSARARGLHKRVMAGVMLRAQQLSLSNSRWRQIAMGNRTDELLAEIFSESERRKRLKDERGRARRFAPAGASHG